MPPGGSSLTRLEAHGLVMNVAADKNSWPPLESADAEIEARLEGLPSSLRSANPTSALEELAELIDAAEGERASALGRHVRSAGIVADLVELVGHDDAEICALAIRVLGNLCSDAVDPQSSATKEVVRKHNGFPRLLPHCYNEELVALMYTLGAIQNLCTSTEYAQLVTRPLRERIREVAESSRVAFDEGGGKGRDAKRAKALAVKKQQMEARIQEKVESWFQKFDADGNNALDKEELRSLLTHLHPEKLADDAALENLMLMAGGASSIIPHGQQSISKEQCMKTVQKYNCYLKDRIQLDELFSQFDKDGSGTLEQSELLTVLEAFAPNDVAPTQADVDFVLSHCDTDGDGSINRNELLPMLAEWKEIALDKELLSLQEAKKKRILNPVKFKKTPRTLTKCQFVFATFEDPTFSPAAKVVSIVMMMVILVSTLAFIAESETLESGALSTVADDANAAFLVIEYVCVIIFTIDYVVRISSCPKVKAFLLNIMNAIDLAAILPFWIFLLPLGMDGGSFAFVRVIRLIRVFRVFKLGRYSVGLQMFAGAMSSSLQPLGILVFVMSINMIIVSSIVHLFEVAYVDDDKPYPDYCFCTITNTFWWAVVTMTTVGYGDCYPITSGGKTVAVITMLSGVLILALPITVIGSNFAKMVDMFEEDNAAYTLTDGDGDGLVDEFELREFIVRKKKEGAFLKNVDTNVIALMAKYDPQGNGTLSKQEFTALQRDCINPSASDPFADIHEMSEKVAANAENFQDIHHMIEARLGAVEFLLAGLGKQPDVNKALLPLNVGLRT